MHRDHSASTRRSLSSYGNLTTNIHVSLSIHHSIAQSLKLLLPCHTHICYSPLETFRNNHWWPLAIMWKQDLNFQLHSWLPITQTLDNSNLTLTQSKFIFPSGHFVTNLTFDNSNFRWLEPFWIPLEGWVIGSQLYLPFFEKSVGVGSWLVYSGFYSLNYKVKYKQTKWQSFIQTKPFFHIILTHFLQLHSFVST